MWLSTLSTRQREALLGLAHNVVVSDGLLDPHEEGMLDQFKRDMDLGPAVEPDYLELDGIEQIFDSRQSRVIALMNLLRISYADGAYEIEEECLLREVGRSFGIVDQELLLLENWVKRFLALEEEARQFWKG